MVAQRTARISAEAAAFPGIGAFLGEQRPTAVNLRWALEDLRTTLKPLAPSVRAAAAYAAGGMKALAALKARSGAGAQRLLEQLK